MPCWFCACAPRRDPRRPRRSRVAMRAWRPVGDLGITQLEGSIQAGKEDVDGGMRPFLRFMSEPIVREIDPEGPAYGKLKKGDVIVAVDGSLITTEGAGRPFVDPPVGVPIDLRIRRDGKEGTVTIVPDWICMRTERVHLPRWIVYTGRTMRLPRVPVEGVGETAPRPPSAECPEPPRPARPERPEAPVPGGPGFPHPWMGIGLKCSVEGNWYTKDLRFTKPPEIFRLEPGSEAEKVGLERGDVLTRIDGIPMDTPEGTEHFVEVRPGQRVEWTVLRDGEPRTIEMDAKPVPQWEKRFKEAENVTYLQPIVDALRYSGILGKTAIEVRGSAPVNVSVDYTLGLVTIKTPDTTIRLKITE